ncbi:MAG: DUF2892 domain-containing protein [Panacibacter sp.]
MKKNMGTADQLIRIVVAILLDVLYFTQTVPGTAGFVLMIAGGVLLATALINFCPVYALLGINTCKANVKK